MKRNWPGAKQWDLSPVYLPALASCLTSSCVFVSGGDIKATLILHHTHGKSFPTQEKRSQLGNNLYHSTGPERKAVSFSTSFKVQPLISPAAGLRCTPHRRLITHTCRQSFTTSSGVLQDFCVAPQFCRWVWSDTPSTLWKLCLPSVLGWGGGMAFSCTVQCFWIRHPRPGSSFCSLPSISQD